ncbi:MAG TPA: ATP-binding protein [Xanthobacteraceae bacterium]|nr:ATP-binding protein [Xanthobacteraceae bacterium]
MRKALIAWSSGKDSAWALHEVRRSGELEVVGAITTVTENFARVSMHGVSEELLLAQLGAARLPPRIVRIPFPCPNEVYEARMAAEMGKAKSEGIAHVIFGDLFLEDIRSYREAQLAKIGMSAVFPLWQRPTAALAREMIAAGLQARLVCVDGSKLSPSFAGRSFDQSLLSDLPPGVDPCGENGEFHTFVSAGPMFEQEIAVRVGKIVERDGFAYADLMPLVPAKAGTQDT